MHVLGYRVPTAVLVAGAVGAVVAVAVAAVLVRRRGLGWGRAVGWAALGWFVLLVVAVTLSPSDSEAAAAGCRFDTGAVLTGWRTDDARLLNALLFVPASALTVLLPRRPAVGLAALVALAVVLELLQSSGPIGRSCDLTDVVDNWTGVALGTAAGLAARRLARPRH